MEKPTFRGRALRGYKKEEVDDFFYQILKEHEDVVGIKKQLEIDKQQMEEKLNLIESHYRNLWEALEEASQKNDKLVQQVEGYKAYTEALKEKLKSLELSNKFIRQKFVNHEMGIPSEFEKQMKRKIVQEEAEDEVIKNLDLQIESNRKFIGKVESASTPGAEVVEQEAQEKVVAPKLKPMSTLDIIEQMHREAKERLNNL